MKNRKILTITILTLSFIFIRQAASFTTTKIENTTKLSVSNSENALIATPNVFVLEVTKEINTTTRVIMSKVSDEEIQSSTEETQVVQILPNTSNYYVRNNMDEIIYVDAYLDKGFLGNEIQGLRIKKPETSAIIPGEIQEISFDIDESISSNIVDILLFVRWTNGSAVIKNQITVDVKEVIKHEYIKEMPDANDIQSENTDI
ncbi:MAG TPA: hypothetical protein GXZ22_07305 [Clostridiaceae bacterium]|nr:hypothetical protein [Clostridiaceae bacterium]